MLFENRNFQPRSPLVALLHSYTFQRSSQVKVHGTLSKTYQYYAGVPQGSVLFPILFNLYIADFPQRTDTKVAFDADDALVYSHETRASDARDAIQRHIYKIIPWCHTWKISINEPKCDSILLTRKKTDIDIDRPLKIHDHPIPISPTLKYLGVILHCKKDSIKITTIIVGYLMPIIFVVILHVLR